ncbi:MAG: hypothetical protein NXI28_25945 [bacterium]|nr:hypothetical protein [bacterium]
MAEPNDDPPICECHMMEVLSETPAYPVTFDDERGAFFLCHDVAFRHCMSCGGALPKPRYTDPIEPDTNEEREAFAIVESAASLEELISVLGKPDEMFSATDWDSTGFAAAMQRVHERYPDTYINDPNLRWTRYARYGSKWPTLCLDVYEYPDGTLEPTVTGLGPDQFVIIERRRWWSRLIPHRAKTT